MCVCVYFVRALMIGNVVRNIKIFMGAALTYSPNGRFQWFILKLDDLFFFCVSNWKPRLSSYNVFKKKINNSFYFGHITNKEYSVELLKSSKHIAYISMQNLKDNPNTFKWKVFYILKKKDAIFYLPQKIVNIEHI